ncbi:DNA (cytosine-5-)-methyltransferase [Fulvivirga sp. 29W222]|uniref:Cytosine-specific methyltransferase n=1 Tax=Fulvivirga marina TaxID=2494733 RepID=A0A937FYA0_9BACT|nr:DNA (cytosine-5-)-methyltransferase [Fulvivirga marina]MBL6446738.1 DNA (cytosine-5-)-methyltransferase [Fulvivirga marina]
MANTYTDVKEILNFHKDKKFTNEHAYITHYFQNSVNGVSTSFKKSAIKYIVERIPEITKANEFDYQYLVPFKWDIPFPSPANLKFRFIDLFAGIGGFRIALQNLGGKCVFSSEIDNSAKQTYEQNFGEYPFGDLRDFTGENISDDELNRLIPDHEILAAGFPCQPFSLAGVSARNHLGLAHGFEDENQGNLFFDIARIISIKKPQVVFLENVKNFKTHDGGKTFETVKSILEDELQYDFHYEVINAEKWVPQKRERFFMVCFKKENKNFTFPQRENEPRKLKEILESDVPKEFTISNKLWEGHQRRTKNNLERGTGFTAFTANLEKPSNTIVARYGKDGKECLIPQVGLNPRKLTPRECARLQGYPENYILPSSNAAAYRQFGNSVAVPVIQSIAENIIKTVKFKLKNEI